MPNGIWTNFVATLASVLLALLVVFWPLYPAISEFIAIANVDIIKSAKFYDRAKRVYYTQNNVRNTGTEALSGPLRLVVTQSTLPVLNADGTTDAGEPFFTVADSDAFSLPPGVESPVIRIEFQRLRKVLDYTLRVEQDATMTMPVLPVLAHAGHDQTVSIGSSVTLDGSRSSHLDGKPLQFDWTLLSVPQGSNAVLSDPGALRPGFTVDVPGTYIFQLIVRDDMASSEPDTVRISTINSAPVARAGADKTVSAGDTATLDGSRSSDFDGDSLTFAWSLVSFPHGSSTAFAEPTTFNPSLQIDVPGTYVAELQVSDGNAVSEVDTVTFTTTNSAPVANAGLDQSVISGDVVQTDASGSDDVDGDPLDPFWSLTVLPQGSTATLTSGSGNDPTLEIDTPGTYVGQLIVNDGLGDSNPDTVVFSTANSVPVANIGAVPPIFVGETVQLDGGGSSDADNDPLEHFWALTTKPAGSAAVLDDAFAIAPSFVTDLTGTYIAQLIVNDGVFPSDPATRVINVAPNTAPVADAGGDQLIVLTTPNSIVQLDGNASFDPEAQPLTFSWSLKSAPAGSSASISNPTLATPTLTVDRPGTFVVELVVNDGALNSAPAMTSITIDFPPLAVTGFNPQSGPIGTLVALTGNNFAPIAGFAPKVTMPAQAGGTINVPIANFNNTSISATIPPGATTGPLTATLEQQSATTAGAFTVEPSSDFTLSALPAAADIIRGQSTSYNVKLNSADGFSQLASLSTSAMPAGVTASFSPSQIAAGQNSILTLSAPAGQPLGPSIFTATAKANIDGFEIRKSIALALMVKDVSTTFLGRTVVDDPQQTPLAGVTASFIGKDGMGGDTTCSAQTVSDAAGNFALTNLPPECAGPQLIRYDGSTATNPPGEYAGVDLFYELDLNQVTASPVLVHLPRIDDAETVLVKQNAPFDQTFTFKSIPNLIVTVYAGTVFTKADGTQPDPFPLIAVDVPIDRLPEEMPANTTALLPFIVAFQPANAVASQPVAVSFPNLLNTPPGTNMPLSTLDPTLGVMVVYGTGTVSSDGRTIFPDLDPANPGKRYGLVHFDWHGPNNPNVVAAGPAVNPGNDCNRPMTQNPIDISSGLEVISETDIAIAGLRGGIAVRRTYRTLSNEAGPFGIGSTHNYGFRLDRRDPQNRDLVNLIMPDGNRLPFARGAGDTLTNVAICKLRGVVMRTTRTGETTLRFKDGTVFRFLPGIVQPSSFLESITDANDNRVELLREPGNETRITEITDPVGRKLRLAYDLANRVTSITDPIGRVVLYTYNAQGTLETVTDAEGGNTRYAYDTQNRLTNITDARGVVVAKNVYDANGRVIQQTRADGGIIRFDYTLLNPLVGTSPVQKTVVTDPLGNKTTYRFNPQGYLTDVTDPLGQKRIFERENGTNLLLTRKGAGVCDVCGDVRQGDRSFTHDEIGNVVTSTNALSNTTTFAYEPRFNKIASITNPLGNVSRFEYDGRGNLVRVEDANGNKTELEVTSNGLIAAIVDPQNNRVEINYDNFGNATHIVDPSGNTSSLRYDAVSRVIEVIDNLRRKTVLSYDLLDRVRSTTDALGRTIEATYDALGNLLTLTDARNNTTSFSYNSLGLLQTRTDSLGRSDTRLYDGNGKLLRYTDRRGQTSKFAYDAIARKILSSFQDGSTISRVYDAYSRLSRVNDSASGAFQLKYDAIGNLLNTSNPIGSVDYTRDALGRVASRKAIGQSAVTYTYDPSGNLRSAVMPKASVAISYDARNQQLQQNRSNGVVSDLSYDALGRLLTLIHKGPTGILDSQSYTYDAAGNRLTASSNLSAPLLTAASGNQYDAESNQILTRGSIAFTHDENGNRLTETNLSGQTTYVWDARNRLVQIQRPNGEDTSFRYDFAGNLIEQSNLRPGGNETSSFLLDDRTNIITLANTSGKNLSILSGQTIDQHEGVIDEEGTVRFGLSDALNSTVSTTNESGQLLSTSSYEPFGTTKTNKNDYPFQYTGRIPVSEGLLFYRARFYDPNIGRFISEDNIGFLGADVNLYRYVRNSPTNFVDPFGLRRSVGFKVGVAGVGFGSCGFLAIANPVFGAACAGGFAIFSAIEAVSDEIENSTNRQNNQFCGNSQNISRSFPFNFSIAPVGFASCGFLGIANPLFGTACAGGIALFSVIEAISDDIIEDTNNGFKTHK